MPQLQSEFLDKVENQLEEQLREVISVFQNLPQEILLQPGSNNGWSIAECMAHLNSYAEFYLPRLTKAIEKAHPGNENGLFKYSLLGRHFIKSMDPDFNKKKFKAMKKHLPLVNDPNSVVSKFIEHLETMLALSRQARHKNLKRNSVATSISPILKMNVGDTLSFLITHNRRHLMQAKRVLAN
jgi:uncharacterized damage-inducible protein DinB